MVKRSQKDVSITSLYQVTLLVDGNRINVIGLADTGNSLTEPITGKTGVSYTGRRIEKDSG